MHRLMYGVQSTKLHAATGPTTNCQPSSRINGIQRTDCRTEKSRLRSTGLLACVLAGQGGLRQSHAMHKRCPNLYALLFIAYVGCELRLECTSCIFL